MTPLHWAVESGDVHCVELLLRHGADVTIENKFDKSPLEIASDKHITEIYEMLLVRFLKKIHQLFRNNKIPLQNADSYRQHSHLETDLATQQLTTELNPHDNQYELTETITVPPEAAHTEVVQTDQKSTSMKILSNFGINMLEEEDNSSNLLGQNLSLTEAGKRLLSDTSPMKTIVASPKMQTVQIKQEGSSTPKIIRINGNAATSIATGSSTGSGQPRVIRLSSSQLSNLKLGNFQDSFNDLNIC